MAPNRLILLGWTGYLGKYPSSLKNFQFPKLVTDALC